MKKYEMTSKVKEFAGRKLFQIRALKDFRDVKAGDLGGYIEKEENLSQEGNAWVYDEAQVFGNARVYGDALIHDNAQIFGHAEVSENAWISGNAWAFGNTKIFDNAWVSDNAWIFGEAQVSGNVWIFGKARIFDNAKIYGGADYIYFRGFGGKNGNITMFRIKNGEIYVSCDRFRGSLKEFEKKAKETHGDIKYAKEYLTCIEMAKIHFEIEN